MTDPDVRSHAAYRATRRFPELDGIRAICIMLVITVHMKDQSWVWLSGALGVTVFFVLSGYLITMLALREEEERGRLSLKAFYIRRGWRILPPYAVVLAAYCVLILGPNVGFSHDKREPFLNALPYYATYLNEFAPSAPFYQSWSLGIEEKFYLLWPVLAFVVLRSRPAPRLTLSLALVVTFECLTVSGHYLFAHYASIMIGCTLAQLLHDRDSFDRLRILGNRFVSLGVLVLFAALQLARDGNPGIEYAYPWIVALVVAGTVYGAHVRVFGWRPLVYVGSRSYGIYLVHLICINLAAAVFHPVSGDVFAVVLSMALVLGLSLLAAEVLHRLVEGPCIAIGRKWSARIS